MNHTLAITLIITAAAFSAFYRLIIKQSEDRLALFAGLNAISTLVGLVAINFVPMINAEALLYLVLSSGFYVAAMFFLSMAYRYGEFSQVTPLQSAVQVLGIALLVVWLYDEPATVVHWIALTLIIVAFMIQSPFKGWFQLHSLVPVAIAVVAGLVSAAQYTADIAGIRAGTTPWTYIAWNLLIGTPIAVYGLLTRPHQMRREFQLQRTNIMIGSLLDMSAYSAVLFVVYYLAMIDILPLLNLNIVFASLLGSVWLKESQPTRRIGASLILLSAAITVEAPELIPGFAQMA